MQVDACRLTSRMGEMPFSCPGIIGSLLLKGHCNLEPAPCVPSSGDEMSLQRGLLRSLARPLGRQLTVEQHPDSLPFISRCLWALMVFFLPSHSYRFCKIRSTHVRGSISPGRLDLSARCFFCSRSCRWVPTAVSDKAGGLKEQVINSIHTAAPVGK